MTLPSTTLHLLVQHPAFHRAHEHDYLDGLHISPSGQSCPSDCYARIVAGAELLDEVMWVFARGLVGNLGAEIIPLSEFFPHHFDDVLSMGIIFGEDEGLGHMGAAREDFCEQPFFESADNKTNLVLGNTSRSSCSAV